MFYNETLAFDQVRNLLSPKALTNAKKYTNNGVEETTDIDKTDNLLIKGNNLLALSSLLENYRNKIKLIYIDPPYNTGNDSFHYNDKFNHSTWLTFMKNRLEIAKDLLSNDGLIFVQIDKNEEFYLKVLMDDIFGRKFFVNSITVQSSTASGNKTAHRDKTIIKTKDTILVYKKTNEIVLNPQYTEQNKWDTHFNSILIKEGDKYVTYSLRDYMIQQNIIDKNYKIRDKSISDDFFLDFVFANKDKIYTTKSSIPADIKKISRNKKDEIIEYKDNNGMKQFAINGRRLGFLNNNIKEVDGIEKIAMLVTDIWTDIDFNNTQNEGGISLPSGKKPERLIKRIIDMTTQENDIVLDFFVGSGTTCAVAHKMNRQYIGIEQMDYIEDKTVQRLKNVVSGEQSGISKLKDVNWNGGGSFIYIELKELNKEFINKIGEATKTEELKSIYKELKDKGLLIPSLETRVLENEEFNDLSFEQQKEVIVLAIDKNKLYVNANQVEDDEINLSDYEKELTHNFYGKDSSDDTRQGTLSI